MDLLNFEKGKIFFQNYIPLSILTSNFFNQLGRISLKIKLLKVLIIVFFSCLSAFAQDFSIAKIEPPNWWVGMKYDTIQLMVYGEDLEGVSVKSEDPDLEILRVQTPENPSYLFIDIIIPEEIKPGTYSLIFYKAEVEKKISYRLLNREIKAE